MRLGRGDRARTVPSGRRSGPLLLGLLLALLFTGLLAPGASAQPSPSPSPSPTAPSSTAPSEEPSPEGTVRWSVSPVQIEGAEPRRVISVDLEPGSGTEDAVRVHNISSVDVTFSLTANDGYRTQSGSFDMRPSDHTPEFGGAWISFDESSVSVPAGAEVIVPFKIDVPENATPGDHIAGVAASIRTEASENVATEHRVGVRVNIRVAGEVSTAAGIAADATSYEMSWNPFAPGRMLLDGQITNNGNIRFAGQLSGTAGGSTSAPGENIEFLPGESRDVTATVDQVWPLGPITVTYSIAAQVVPAPGGTGDGAVVEPMSYSVTVWAIPWPQIILLLLIAGVVFLILRARRAKANRLQKMLDDARAEGARTARDDAPAS